MKKPTQLMRNCLSCGLEKPLAAFLQISGTQGTNYGNICSDCRSTIAKDKKTISLDEDDTSRGSAGVRIGTKERVFSEIQQKIEIKQQQELHKEELEKREKNTFEKTERIEKRQQDEKSHRENYIDAKKKQSFLNFKSNPPPNTQSQFNIQKTQQATAFNIKSQQQLDEIASKKASQHEYDLANIDTSQPFLDSQFGELKFQSVIFKQFKEWLGEGANFRTMERLAKGTMEKKGKGKDEIKTKNEVNAKDEKKSADPILEFERKSWKPTGRR